MLEVRGVSISFGGLKAVDRVDMDVAEGEIAGLIGPNGAGKTTVFNLITGLYAPDEGSIVFRGQAIHGQPPHRITELGVARTFQNIRLFGTASALENVMMARHCRTRSGSLAAIFFTRAFRQEEAKTRVRALELLEFVGLADVRDVRAADLPYGLQRRLEIARALATEPQLLLLDEPAAGMNETESESLMQLIRRIRDELGTTVLLIDHDMRVVMGLCDTITVLNFGRRLAHGRPDEVRSNPDVIEAYLGRE
ncbi:MAG TPA: ABC transporter ATP-binding protein [Limnochordales bacterium]